MKIERVWDSKSAWLPLNIHTWLPPEFVTPFLPKILSLKGGGVPPTSVTFFGDQNQVSSLGKKTQFSALFEDIFLGNVLKGEGGVLPSNPYLFLQILSVKRGGVPPLRTKSAK